MPKMKKKNNNIRDLSLLCTTAIATSFVSFCYTPCYLSIIIVKSNNNRSFGKTRTRQLSIEMQPEWSIDSDGILSCVNSNFFPLIERIIFTFALHYNSTFSMNFSWFIHTLCVSMDFCVKISMKIIQDSEKLTVLQLNASLLFGISQRSSINNLQYGYLGFHNLCAHIFSKIQPFLIRNSECWEDIFQIKIYSVQQKRIKKQNDKKEEIETHQLNQRRVRCTIDRIERRQKLFSAQVIKLINR